MAALLISGFMGMFSETALNMAIHDLINEFHISASTAQWLTTGYLLVLGILIPVSGLLIKRFPTRNLFITSLSFSIVGLLVAGVSPSFSVLLSGRMIQAVGTGLLLPLLFHTVLVLFPPAKRGTAMGLVGLVMMFAPALGPVSAGFIIEYLNWHMIFWIIIPFLVFAIVFGIAFLPNLTEISKHRIDMLSIVLSTIGFGGIVFGISYAGEREGWSSPVVLIALIAGIIALAVYIIRQLSIDEPVLYLQVFKRPMFTLGIIVTLFANIIIFSSNILLPLYMQGGLGLSASKAGLLLLPGGIINGIMSMVNGRIFDKYGPRGLVIGGFVISTIVVWLFSIISSFDSAYIIIFFYMLLMVSMSMVTTPSQTNGINQLDPSLYPDGTAMVNSMIQTSGAMGTAIAISILNGSKNAVLSQVNHPSGIDQAEAIVTGVQHAFAFAAFVSLAGFICSLFIKRVQVE
ncbi:DHA2 family efflux MFS transporter permease subunit [Lentibacillus cibarius]|uniref:Multidrug efflux MFS transporter n=1 Tax=Lentibacillus cibarius TaxID=2583219 RepID=A0A5S3QQ01_9BACI|nr:DHA2 family efflux MFS transporter permease subunit [Lentibacillus cibarius]TMN23899.1 multidrug efflux MFS transporter [Lentibacillus cibarius]